MCDTKDFVSTLKGITYTALDSFLFTVHIVFFIRTFAMKREHRLVLKSEMLKVSAFPPV